MAYRRTTRNGYRARARTTYRAAGRGRSTGRRVARRAPARGRSAGQTVRIVLETAPVSAVSRTNPLSPVIAAKNNGKARL